VPDAEGPVEPALGDVHASVLHTCCASPAHGVPLPEGVGLSQPRICIPPSHDAEQLDQALQPPFTCCVAHSGPLQPVRQVQVGSAVPKHGQGEASQNRFMLVRYNIRLPVCVKKETLYNKGEWAEARAGPMRQLLACGLRARSRRGEVRTE